MAKMLDGGFSTAPPVITRPSTIAALLLPSAISRSTSCSGGVSAASGASLSCDQQLGDQLGSSTSRLL